MKRSSFWTAGTRRFPSRILRRFAAWRANFRQGSKLAKSTRRSRDFFGGSRKIAGDKIGRRRAKNFANSSKGSGARILRRAAKSLEKLQVAGSNALKVERLANARSSSLDARCRAVFITNGMKELGG